MILSIAHLGPTGTNAETAALIYAQQVKQQTSVEASLHPYASNAQTLKALAQGEVEIAVVPVENSIEGTVSVTLDTLWQLDWLKIQQAIVLPIRHALISLATDVQLIKTVYSHPQALAQCQEWLGINLPTAQLVPTNSTTEPLQHLEADLTASVISSQRAANLYNLPILAYPINDYPDNCTRFWVMSQHSGPGGEHTSLAFSVGANAPGALVKPLQIFADRNINLSKIESRPTKRSLGDYLFFIDIEANLDANAVQSALLELAACTETLKIFGSYAISTIKE